MQLRPAVLRLLLATLCYIHCTALPESCSSFFNFFLKKENKITQSFKRRCFFRLFDIEVEWQFLFFLILEKIFFFRLFDIEVGCQLLVDCRAQSHGSFNRACSPSLTHVLLFFCFFCFLFHTNCLFFSHVFFAEEL